MAISIFTKANDYIEFKTQVAAMADPHVFYRSFSSFNFRIVANSPAWDGKRSEFTVAVILSNGGGSTDVDPKPVTFDTDFPSAIRTESIIGNGFSL